MLAMVDVAAEAEAEAEAEAKAKVMWASSPDVFEMRKAPGVSARLPEVGWPRTGKGSRRGSGAWQQSSSFAVAVA